MHRRASSSPFLALVGVVHDPFAEPDCAGHLEAVVLDALAKALEVAAAFDVLIKVADPRLNAVVTGLGSDLDLLNDVELLARNRAGVQTVTEWVFLRLLRRSDGGCRGCGQPNTGGRCGVQQVAARKVGTHHCSSITVCTPGSAWASGP
jgi:hypothetical protein